MTGSPAVGAPGVVSALLALALALVAGTSAAAQDRDVVLRAEFPVDLASPPSPAAFSGLVEPGFIPRVPDGEAAEALLSEARWTFAGMIWGFDYVYTPSDRARSIAELFEITSRSPGAAINPKAVAARLDGTTLIATIEYYPDSSQRVELASWKQLSAVEQGRGTAPAFPQGGVPQGVAAASAVEARREAATAAVKEALRSFLRELTHNKPREVRGSFAFASTPRLFIRNGAWIASVRIYARVDEIVSYGAY